MIQKFRLSHYANSAESAHERNYKTLKADAFIFSFESYYISEYIERNLRRNKSLKEQTKDIEKLDRIVHINIGIDYPKRKIQLHKKSRILAIQYEKVYDDIKPLRGKNRAEKILSIVEDTSCDVEHYINGFEQIIKEIINKFREENYQNRWQYAKKRITGIGTVMLVCELTIFDFTLDLIIEDKDKNILLKKTILKTLPDSLFYHRKFKSLELVNGEIRITQRLKETPLFSISVEEALLIGIDTEILYEKKNIPQSWSDFKKCMQEPEDVPCPRYEDKKSK